MIKIIDATTNAAIEHVIVLSHEYVTWMLAEIRVHYPQLDINEFTSEHDYDDIRKKFPGEHIPPYGCLLLAMNDGDVCGCIALGKLTDSIGEVRTLFVRPSCRGAGIGKLLVGAVLSEARQIGYNTVRLDTLGFMTSALNLYRGFGFYDIAPYRDISAQLQHYICFLELTLTNSA